MNEYKFNTKNPSLSMGSSVLGTSNQLPPNSLFYLFANNISGSFTTTPTSNATTSGVQSSSTSTLNTSANTSSVSSSSTTVNTTPTTSTVPLSSTSTNTSNTVQQQQQQSSSQQQPSQSQQQTQSQQQPLQSQQTSQSQQNQQTQTSTQSTSSSQSQQTSQNVIVIESNKEDDKECGTILLEISKGIRSGNLGEQVESILFYSHLIRFHPSPLVVNSVITKLSDIFRTTTNLVKYRILKVFQECSNEIHKVSSIEDVLKRIHSVILSNDPIARSLSLRILASVPYLIADKLYIHHSIRSCMQSHDRVEIEATIFIMDKLCEVSPLFSDSIIEKIHKVIQNVETPPTTKLKYIKLFRHMHHSHSIATQSKDMLVGLLDLYPSEDFVTVILDTLTNLSLKHILYIDDHITFLKNYGFLDPRIKVKVITLKCLQRLAKASPHSQFPIIEIIKLLRDTPENYKEIKYHTLLFLSILSSSSPQYLNILKLSQSNNNNSGSSNNNNNNDQLQQHNNSNNDLNYNSIISLLYQYSLDYDFSLSELAIQTLTNLIVESNNNSSNNNDNNNNNNNNNNSNNNQLIESILNQLLNNICIILKTQFTKNLNKSVNSNNNSNIKLTKHSILLKSIIQLVQRYPKILKSISITIISTLNEIPYDIIKSLFYCLSICIPLNKNVIEDSIDDILNYLKQIIIKENSSQLINNINDSNNNNNDNNKSYISSLPMSIFVCIFKSFDNDVEKIEKITNLIIPIIEYIFDNPKQGQLWCLYHFAHLAQRYGFHLLASTIYSNLIYKVESEYNYLWLKSLLSISNLENEISQALIDTHSTSKDGGNGSSNGIGSSSGSSNDNFSKIFKQLSNYHTLVLTIKASSTLERSLQFQEDFILLREKYLFNLLNLRVLLLQNNNNDNNQINEEQEEQEEQEHNRMDIDNNNNNHQHYNSSSSSNNNNNNQSNNLKTKYQIKLLQFKQLSQKYSILLNNQIIKYQNLKQQIPIDTKQILESFIESCNLIIKLINLILVNNNNQNQNQNQLNNNNHNEEKKEYNSLNNFPLSKFCNFILKKLDNENYNNNSNNNNNNNILVDLLNEIIESLIKIPNTIPSSFFLK